MTTATKPQANVQQAVPFFGVRDIQTSVRFYVDGLGFSIRWQWTPEGALRWCWLDLGTASVMLQEFWRDGPHRNVPQGPVGEGVSVCFVCRDALTIYRDLIARGLPAKKPFVGNGMWVTEVSDPDGYHLFFESPTDTPEDTVFADEA